MGTPDQTQRAGSVWCLTLGVILTCIPTITLAQDLRIQPEVQLESRFFPQSPQFRDQFDVFQGGIILTGDARWRSEDRNTRMVFEPYLRIDSADEERTYFDVREATVSQRFGDWELLAGAGQVFWGVAESRNVVDIINQFDTIEDFDQEQKLGQPMLRLSHRGEIGYFEAYYLPYFREQRFIGPDGRIRGNPAVDGDAAVFTRDGEEWAGDVALRYEVTSGPFDLGLHAFYGTSREAMIRPAAGGRLIPVYQERSQAGIDLQYTEGPWLLKLETIGVSQGGERFVAGVTGFEYTFFDIESTGIDVGLIGEYLYDGRDMTRTPVTLFENDFFAGTRITVNDFEDTELLIGAIVDLDTQAVIASAEFQRRLTDNLLVEIEARLFAGGDDPVVQSVERDSFVTVRLSYFF